jgi:hypothetical protein
MIAAFMDIDMKTPTYPEVNKADRFQVAVGDLRMAWLQCVRILHELSCPWK